MYIWCFMTLINKNKLFDEMYHYCKICEKSKNFDTLDCIDCKFRIVFNAMDNLEQYTEFVPKEKYDKMLRFVAPIIEGCPYKNHCPGIDDDQWECSDCWEDFLRKQGEK